MSTINILVSSVLKIAQLQAVAVDRLAFQDAATNLAESGQSRAQVNEFMQYLQLPSPKWLSRPDPAATPLLMLTPAGRWQVLRGINSAGHWVSEWWDADCQQWREQADEALLGHQFASLKLVKSYKASSSPVFRLILEAIFSRKKWLIETVVAGVVVNLMAILVSLYTLLVYDRVVPSGASQTLLVLTLGISIAVLYELLTKKVRSGLFDRLINEVDQRLARAVYMRFLNIRLDQLPQSVGGLAAQLRGYETLRNFLAGITTQVLVDAPYALFFLGVIYLIAGWLAFIPLAFLCLSVMIGWYFKQQIALLAQQANGASHFKTGLLVETVEGAETIKSGQGGWRMLSRWMNTTDQARGYELEMRTISDSSQHMVVSFQQFSYIALIASGALMVSQGELTIGSLIACSILSGRILTPVASIPHQLLLWAHTKAALTSLDEIWKLQDDHHGQVQPLVLNSIKGHYEFENVTTYYGNSVALTVTKLQIKPGEKIAVLGPVGSGKTTLLRLLSGMYKPQEGRIRLDNVDLAHLSKPVLAEHTGYVHQEGRLFAGTVRENLILGLLDPGDEVLLSVARKTGLLQTVIAAHPLGLQRPISEGGIGLSGGQRQLVNLTRAVLRKPTIWLLDEPTASMDGSLEMRLKTVLNDALKPQHTLVLVTHKTDMLDLVERIIVIAQHKVLMDGPKHEVLKQLQASERLPASVDSNVRGKIV